MNQNIISTEEAKKASLAELLQKQRSTEKGISDYTAKSRSRSKTIMQTHL